MMMASGMGMGGMVGKSNICDYPLKLFFDIGVNDVNGDKQLLSDSISDILLTTIYSKKKLPMQ